MKVAIRPLPLGLALLALGSCESLTGRSPEGTPRVETELAVIVEDDFLNALADVDAYYKQLIRNDSTHHLSNGQISGISLYKALRRLADAYPDESGQNTAISMSLDAKMAQVFVIHPADDGVVDDVTTH